MIEYLDWWVRESTPWGTLKTLMFLHKCPSRAALGSEKYPWAAGDFSDWPVCGKCSAQLSDKDIDKIRFILSMKRT